MASGGLPLEIIRIDGKTALYGPFFAENQFSPADEFVLMGLVVWKCHFDVTACAEARRLDKCWVEKCFEGQMTLTGGGATGLNFNRLLFTVPNRAGSTRGMMRIIWYFPLIITYLHLRNDDWLSISGGTVGKQLVCHFELSLDHAVCQKVFTQVLHLWSPRDGTEMV